MCIRIRIRILCRCAVTHHINEPPTKLTNQPINQRRRRREEEREARVYAKTQQRIHLLCVHILWCYWPTLTWFPLTSSYSLTLTLALQWACDCQLFSFPWPFLWHVVLCRKKNRTSEAVRMLKRCTEIDATYVQAHLELFRLHRGSQSALILTDAIKANPDNLELRLAFGHWLLNNGK